MEEFVARMKGMKELSCKLLGDHDGVLFEGDYLALLVEVVDGRLGDATSGYPEGLALNCLKVYPVGFADGGGPYGGGVFQDATAD